VEQKLALLWLSCPHCRVFFHIDDASAGRQVACRACGNLLRIPGTVSKITLWYYTLDRKPVGPVTFEQLTELARSGVVRTDGLVWQEGMAQWAPATSVAGLFPAPPPLPPIAAPPAEEIPEVEEVAEPQPTAASSEPEYEVVDNEPLEQPIPAPFEPRPTESMPQNESAALGGPEPSKAAHEDNWGEVPVRTNLAEVPIQVEPEFQIDFASSVPPPVRRPAEAEAPPTVDLVLPGEEKRDSIVIAPNIELAPEDPKLELGSPDAEDDEWLKGYDVAKWPVNAAGDCVAVPEAAGPPPLAPYALAQDRHERASETGPLAAAPTKSEDIAAAPMAIPVLPSGEPPRRITEDDKLTREARKRREYVQERVAWRRVRTGINLVYLALAIWTGTLACYFIVSCGVAVFSGESMSSASSSGAGAVLVAVLLLLLALAVDAVSIVGFCFCLQVPASEGSRPLAIATLALTVCTFMGAFVAPFVPSLQLIVLGLGFARWLIFLFFLQTIAQFFEAHYLQKSIERLLVLFGGGSALGFFLWFGMAYLTSRLAPKGLEETDLASLFTLACGTLCTLLPLLALLGLTTVRFLHAMRDTVATIDTALYRG
jgi:hypothetical protein